MMNKNWQMQNPVAAIVFDCDGTLSSIEGVDELAKTKGVGAQVSALTAQAMSVTGLTQALYQERLQLIFPSEEQVIALGQKYFHHVVSDAELVIHILQKLNKSVYIMSAGLYPAVAHFANFLKIPNENIFAVKIQFDDCGHFIDFDRASPLVTNDGKRKMIANLLHKHDSIIHIGDGLNDVVVHDLVTRFIGFGGCFYRENIAARCEYYIETATLLPLLPLILTKAEVDSLTAHERTFYDKGLALYTRCER